MTDSSHSRKRQYKATSYALYATNAVSECRLTDVITSLPSENDDGLKKFVDSRLSRGSVFAGNGQVCTVDLGIEPASCYFCLLNPFQKDDDQFVVCFVTECNRGLDSFRMQLDQHASKIESIIKDSNKTNLIENVKPVLESWYQNSLYFIVNCVQTLGKHIKYVIYNALANGQISIDTDDKQLENDIERFHSSCAMSALLNQTIDSSSDGSGSLVDLDSEPRTKTKKIVDILCITSHNGEAPSFSDVSTTKFCDDWAQTLFEKYAYSLAELGDVNPNDLKVICENYKLKTIQDMNTLKRLIKQAEFDFYALYRSYVFLKRSGNHAILLMHALNDDQSFELITVLKLLQEYFRDN